MQPSPVVAATLPSAATTPTWRRKAAPSAPAALLSASVADAPAAMAARQRGPYAGSPRAWVATAPTPGRAQGTTVPTPNVADWTATPSSPVSGSRATIEYVIGFPLGIDEDGEQRTEDLLELGRAGGPLQGARQPQADQAVHRAPQRSGQPPGFRTRLPSLALGRGHQFGEPVKRLMGGGGQFRLAQVHQVPAEHQRQQSRLAQPEPAVRPPGPGQPVPGCRPAGGGASRHGVAEAAEALGGHMSQQVGQAREVPQRRAVAYPSPARDLPQRDPLDPLGREQFARHRQQPGPRRTMSAHVDSVYMS